jgi:hypoxanthine phosphoribosyltransferase
MQFKRISWTQLEKDTLKTVAEIKDIKFDKIISISRGGLVVSRIVSDILSIQISHIVISSYIGNQKQGKPYICELPGGNFYQQNILIVDEVSDTGDTLKQAVPFVKNLSPKKIATFAPYIKSRTKFIPDYYSQKTDDWIIFPYDIRETYENFMKEFGSKKEALFKMQEIGFQDWELEFIS